MGRVGRALIVHELQQRLRDRWVIVTTVLFALLAAGIALYGRSAGDAGAVVTAPSLVTLSALLVPLVALVLGFDTIVGDRERNTLGLLLSLPIGRAELLVSRFIGRGLALCIAVVLGLGAAAIFLPAGQRAVLLSMVVPTLLLGTSFLSLGVCLSVLASRPSTAASLAVAVWFLLVFFYDLAVLGALIATGGALGQQVVAWLVSANPAGLYRVGMLAHMTGKASLSQLGLAVRLPGSAAQAGIWAAWILGPLGLGVLVLSSRRAVTG